MFNKPLTLVSLVTVIGVALIGACDDNMVVALAWDPADTDRVFAGTDKGTIHMSTNRGASWGLICDTISTVAVGAIAVSSFD